MVTKEAKFPRITKVWAKNFRSIESLELELAPLTVLVGPNASGKSNIVDVLRFVSDAVRDGLESALISRRGDHVARRSNPSGRFTDVSIGLIIDIETPSVEDETESNSSVIYEFTVRLYRDGHHRVIQEKAGVKLSDTDPDPLYFEIKYGRMVRPLLKRPRGMPLALFKSLNFTTIVKAETADGTELAFPFRNIYSTVIFFSRGAQIGLSTKYLHSLLEGGRFLENLRFYHIFPDALREPQLMASKYPLEEHGENLASVLDDMKRKGSPYFPELLGALGLVARGVKDISITRAGGHLVVKLLHSDDAGGKGVWLDASQESDGTLRTLGLLVALYQDPTPPFIAIEEPELTIHPGALSVLADVILETSRRSSLLVTTHSPELLDSLPIDCIRSVQADDGATKVGAVAEHQKAAVLKGLFSPGELHRIEGLQLAAKDD